MKLAIMGLSACGKSTQARKLASAYGLSYLSGSGLLLAKLGFQDDPSCHFWLEEAGRQLESKRDDAPVDREVDNTLLARMYEEVGVVTDSWTIPWLYRELDLVRVYLTPSLEARASRAMGSKQTAKYDVQELARRLDAKDERTRKRFQSLYGIDIGDTRGFDLVLNTTRMEFDATQKLIRAFIDAHTLR